MESTAQELEEQLPTFEKIAEDIQQIADAMRSLSRTRISRGLLVTLLHETTKVKKTDIRYILDNLEQMDLVWLKRLPKQL